MVQPCDIISLMRADYCTSSSPFTLHPAKSAWGRTQHCRNSSESTMIRLMSHPTLPIYRSDQIFGQPNSTRQVPDLRICTDTISEPMSFEVSSVLKTSGTISVVQLVQSWTPNWPRTCPDLRDTHGPGLFFCHGKNHHHNPETPNDRALAWPRPRRP